MAPLMLLVVLFISTSNAQLFSSPAGCDNEQELQSSLSWVRETCEEAGEIFLDPAVLVPTAVTTADCADAVHRVSQRRDRPLSIRGTETRCASDVENLP